MNLRFLDRYNLCEMHGVCDNTGRTFSRSEGPFPCFHAAFAFMSNCKYTYSINYDLYIQKICDGYNNNFATLSKKDMCRILNSIKYLVPFHYKFEENDDFYIIHIKLEHATALQHKGLLMLSRMLFEFPHNMCAKDALDIRDQCVLKDMDIRKFSIVQLYLICISSTIFSRSECFIRNNAFKMISSDFLKNKLREKGRGWISNVVPYVRYSPKIIEMPYNTDERDNVEKVKERYNVYSINLKNSLDV